MKKIILHILIVVCALGFVAFETGCRTKDPALLEAEKKIEAARKKQATAKAAEAEKKAESGQAKQPDSK